MSPDDSAELDRAFESALTQHDFSAAAALLARGAVVDRILHVDEVIDRPHWAPLASLFGWLEDAIG